MALGMRSLGQRGLSEIANRVEAGEKKSRALGNPGWSMLAALSYSPLDSPKSIQKLKVPDSDAKKHKVSNKMKRVSITMKLT